MEAAPKTISENGSLKNHQFRVYKGCKPIFLSENVIFRIQKRLIRDDLTTANCPKVWTPCFATVNARNAAVASALERRSAGRPSITTRLWYDTSPQIAIRAHTLTPPARAASCCRCCIFKPYQFLTNYSTVVRHLLRNRVSEKARLKFAGEQ